MFCPHCGNATDIIPGMVVAEERDSEAVQLARIEAERDIKIAQLQARQDRDYNETRAEVAEIEADAMVEAATAEAVIIGAAIEGSEPAEAEPIEIIAPEISEDPVPDGDELPPAEGSPVPAPAARARGLGMW